MSGLDYPFLVLTDPDDLFNLSVGVDRLMAESACCCFQKKRVDLRGGGHDLFANKLVEVTDFVVKWVLESLSVVVVVGDDNVVEEISPHEVKKE